MCRRVSWRSLSIVSIVKIDSACCLIYNALTTGQGARTMNDQDKSAHDGNSRSNGAQERETIARLTAEVERLRGRLATEKYADDLREALIMAAAVGTIASPVAHSRLLEMIVEAAAHVISARAASLFLINRETQE